MTDEGPTRDQDRASDQAGRRPGLLTFSWVGAAWFVGAGLLVLMVLAAFARFHVPGHGFTYVLDFGETMDRPRMEKVAALPVYIHEGVPGYDAQFYAQLALSPHLDDPELGQSIDSLPYRARRFLMAWTAWVLGLGDSWRILNIYACLNLVTWLLLAVLLLHWFRPVGVGEFLAWSGVMLSAGMLLSLRHALPDGPAVLFLALAMLLLEGRHPWAAAACGALGPLARETSLLNAVIFAPSDWREWRSWGPAVLRGAIMVLPLVAWTAYVYLQTGAGLRDGAGARNLTIPFLAYAWRWEELLGGGRTNTPFSFPAILCHLALTVQALWIVVRPVWSSAWWRVGAVHVVLMATLGEAVWEGIPGAAPRVLLPLTLSFNVLAPKRRWGVVLLVAGNLGIFAGIEDLAPPPRPIWSVASAASDAGVSRPPLEVHFREGFYETESSGGHSWRWAADRAALVIENKGATPLLVRLRLSLASRREREVMITTAGKPIWSGLVAEERRMIETESFDLPVESTTVELRASSADRVPGDERALAVRVFQVEVETVRLHR